MHLLYLLHIHNLPHFSLFPAHKSIHVVHKEYDEVYNYRNICRILKRCENAESGEVVGLYILHPNNVGRCGHICNASYAVRRDIRGEHIGEKLVLDCISMAKKKGFGVLQFNAVVASNVHALHLYKRIGFTPLGVIPGGFRMPDGHYEDIIPHYYDLRKDADQ